MCDLNVDNITLILVLSLVITFCQFVISWVIASTNDD
jgi:hypothetical protein